MISDIVRKLNGYLSFWIKDNEPVNCNKDKLIKKYIQKNISLNKIINKNLKKTHNIFNQKLYLLLQKKKYYKFLKGKFYSKNVFLA